MQSRADQLNVTTINLTKSVIDKEIVTILQADAKKCRLDIRFCAVEIDLQYLLAAIRTLSLTFLSIRFCKLTDEHAPLVAKFIESNPIALEGLDLSNNRFTEKGASLILKALEKNTVLNSLTFRNNELKDQSVIKQFENTCKQNQRKKLAAMHDIAFPFCNQNVISVVESYLNLGLFSKMEKPSIVENTTCKISFTQPQVL
ncbi:MAG: hypothetical protein ACYCQI_12970 [Gammaproteobacteria bacterium]